MPAKMTLAGENTYQITSEDARSLTLAPQVETYQTDAPRDGGRKRGEDIDSWAQPLCQSLIATMRFVKFSNLIFKDSNDSSSGVARLQLRDKRMCDEVFLRLLSVGLQCS